MQEKLKHPFIPLYFISFIFSIQYGLVVYINSSFLELAVPAKIVSIIFAVASLVTILVLLEIPLVLNRLGNYKTTIFFVVCNALALFMMSVTKSSYIIITSFIIYTATNYCLVLTRDVFIEDYIKVGEIGRVRGIFLTIINLALVLSPALAVFILTKTSYFGVYLTAALFTLSALFFMIPALKNFKDPAYRKISISETLKKASGDLNLKKIYIAEFLLCFFYSWMIVYTPIYLHEYIGFDWQSIGLIFTVMLIPFVLVDYPLGRLSDKIGEKKILALGFLIMAVATTIIFFVKMHSSILWAILLFITRVGAASVEVMCESYFFKKTKASDADLISLFRNMYPFSFIISPLIAIVILFLVPHFKYIFPILGSIMLLGCIVTLQLKEIR